LFNEEVDSSIFF